MTDAAQDVYNAIASNDLSFGNSEVVSAYNADELKDIQSVHPVPVPSKITKRIASIAAVTLGTLHSMLDCSHMTGISLYAPIRWAISCKDSKSFVCCS